MTRDVKDGGEIKGGEQVIADVTPDDDADDPEEKDVAGVVGLLEALAPKAVGVSSVDALKAGVETVSGDGVIADKVGVGEAREGCAGDPLVGEAGGVAALDQQGGLD